MNSHITPLHLPHLKLARIPFLSDNVGPCVPGATATPLPFPSTPPPIVPPRRQNLHPPSCSNISSKSSMISMKSWQRVAVLRHVLPSWSTMSTLAPRARTNSRAWPRMSSSPGRLYDMTCSWAAVVPYLVRWFNAAIGSAEARRRIEDHSKSCTNGVHVSECWSAVYLRSGSSASARTSGTECGN